MRQLGVGLKAFGGVLAFCAFAFAPINRADAGCGDYLTMDHSQPMAGKQSGVPMKPGTTLCNGPNCHRHDGPPLTPAPEFRAAPTTFKIAAIFTDVSTDLNRFSERWPDSDTRPLSGYTSSILRPPRTV